MDFWFNLKKARKEQFPECYSFLLEDSRELLNMALTVSKEEHEERMQKCKELVNTYQYAVGGELLHRGYYCPSPVKDIVMGNCNRGKMIKHPIKFEQKMMYEYGFCDDQLLLIKHNIDCLLYTSPGYRSCRWCSCFPSGCPPAPAGSGCRRYTSPACCRF